MLNRYVTSIECIQFPIFDYALNRLPQHLRQPAFEEDDYAELLTLQSRLREPRFELAVPLFLCLSLLTLHQFFFTLPPIPSIDAQLPSQLV